jgi:PAS domain S-box-containing protein
MAGKSTDSTTERFDEIRHLRGCINDLVSLLALPAMWSERNPHQIIETLLDTLVGILRLDFSYVRLKPEAAAQPIEVVRLAQYQPALQSQKIGQALASYLTSDSFTQPLTLPNPLGEGQVNIVRLSLGLQKELGQIIAGSGRPDFPTETETLLLRVAANQAAIALKGAQVARYRKQAEISLREQTEVVETINRIGQTLSAELDQQKLVQALTDAATELTGAKFGSFFYNLTDERGESYMLYTLSGVPLEAFAHFPMPRNTDIFGPTFRGEGVIRLADVKQDARYGKSSPYFGMPAGHLPVTSYLAVPVISRSGEVLGGLFFGHPEADIFTERHERIIVGLAAQAAIAMDNARLFNLAQRERTQAQAAQRQVVSILDSITDSFIALDKDWCYTYLNRAAEKLLLPLQIPGSEVLGKNFWNTFPDLVDSVVYEQFQHAVRAQVSVECEIFYPPLNRWLNIRAFPSNEGLAVYIQDITVRRQAEQARAHLAAIVASSDDAIISKNLHSIITSWNKGAEKLFGYTAAEAIGQSITMLMPPQYVNEEPQILEQIRRGETIDHYETVRQRKDGTTLDISLTISPIRDEAGNIIGASKIARDITQQKRVQAEREQLLASEQEARRQSETANRMKDEFLATVSHELRTPLNAMLGWSRLLSGGSLDHETAKRGLQSIEQNAKAQSQLIEDLLDVSRIISGKFRLKAQPLEVAAVIEAAIDSVRPAVDAKGIRLEVILDPDAGPVSGDAGRLQQVVWNLLSNAIKFTPKGGRVQVRLLRINSHVEIEVSDTGQGISAEFLPYVFERFRQADGSISRSHGGLGLGLAIVRHIAELHGGTVAANSPGKDQGATFTIRLPLMVAHTKARSEERAHPRVDDGLALHFQSSQTLEGVKILIVDDEPESLLLLSTMLTESGAYIKTAASAVEGLARVKEWSPDVIVSDIGMPGEDGYSFMKRVKTWTRQAGVWIPAVALTAYARTEDRMKALASGYQIHVPKPVEPAELITVLVSLVERH